MKKFGTPIGAGPGSDSEYVGLLADGTPLPVGRSTAVVVGAFTAGAPALVTVVFRVDGLSVRLGAAGFGALEVEVEVDVVVSLVVPLPWLDDEVEDDVEVEVGVVGDVVVGVAVVVVVLVADGVVDVVVVGVVVVLDGVVEVVAGVVVVADPVVVVLVGDVPVGAPVPDGGHDSVSETMFGIPWVSVEIAVPSGTGNV